MTLISAQMKVRSLRKMSEEERARDRPKTVAAAQAFSLSKRKVGITLPKFKFQEGEDADD